MSKEAMKLALEALDAGPNAYLLMNTGGIANKLRQAIAEAEKQEPIGCTDDEGNAYQYGYTGPKFAPNIKLYANPQPKREPLTDEIVGLLKEARKIIRASSSRNLVKDWDARTTKAIAAHGIKE
jgi:hypothetical protein